MHCQQTICFAASTQAALQEVYCVRHKMHEHVYQGTAVKAFELMLADVLGLLAPWLDLDWLRLLQDFDSAGEAVKAGL